MNLQEKYVHFTCLRNQNFNTSIFFFFRYWKILVCQSALVLEFLIFMNMVKMNEYL